MLSEFDVLIFRKGSAESWRLSVCWCVRVVQPLAFSPLSLPCNIRAYSNSFAMCPHDQALQEELFICLCVHVWVRTCIVGRWWWWWCPYPQCPVPVSCCNLGAGTQNVTQPTAKKTQRLDIIYTEPQNIDRIKHLNQCPASVTSVT